MVFKNVMIRLAEESEATEINDLYKLHFINVEPMQGAYIDRFDGFDEIEFYVDAIKKETVLVAVDNENEKLAGALVAKKLNSTGTSSCTVTGNIKLDDLINFITYIDEKSKIFEKFKAESCLQIFTVCVHPDYKKQGIATKLFEACFSLGKSQHFDLISVDCTSNFTTKIAEKLKMLLISSVTYDEYNRHLGKRLFTPVTPHTDIKTFAKLL